MIRLIVLLGVFLFVVCLTCWLIVPRILGSFDSTAKSIPFSFMQVVMVILPLFLFALIGFVVLKARSES